MSTRTRIAAAAFVAAAGASVLVAAPAQAATPDTACMQAGIATLKAVGLHSAVAKNGITVGTAVSVGVTPRNGLPDGLHPRHGHPLLDAARRPPRR